MVKLIWHLFGALLIANREAQDLVLNYALMDLWIGGLAAGFLQLLDISLSDHPKFPRMLAKWVSWSYTVCTIIYVVPFFAFCRYYKATRGLEVLPMGYEEVYADAYRLAAVASVVAVVALGAMLSQACLEKAAAEGGTDAKVTTQGA